MSKLFAKLTRDLALWVLGFLGVIHELFLVGKADPAKLGFCALLLSLPLALRRDEKRREKAVEDGADAS